MTEAAKPYLDFIIPEKAIIYLTYSYKEGIRMAFILLGVALVFALVNTLASYLIGIRKRECMGVFFTNFLIKPIALLYFELGAFYNMILVMIAFAGVIFLEGIVYSKILRNSENNGFKISLKCNILGLIIAICLILVFCLIIRLINSF